MPVLCAVGPSARGLAGWFARHGSMDSAMGVDGRRLEAGQSGLIGRFIFKATIWQSWSSN